MIFSTRTTNLNNPFEMTLIQSSGFRIIRWENENENEQNSFDVQQSVMSSNLFANENRNKKWIVSIFIYHLTSIIYFESFNSCFWTQAKTFQCFSISLRDHEDHFIRQSNGYITFWINPGTNLIFHPKREHLISAKSNHSVAPLVPQIEKIRNNRPGDDVN
jgi:hypothetical protein